VITMRPQDTVVSHGALASFIRRQGPHTCRGNPAKLHGNLPAGE
jgi:hypothetical protein